MEQVAGRAELLAKSKAQEAPPPPFRKRSTKSIQGLDWDPKMYSEGGKESRDEQNKKRTIRVFGMEQLGVDEYQKLMREIDSMTGSAELDRIVKKWVQEVKERLENERLAREADERRQTRSQTEAAGTSTSTEPVPPVPSVGSPRKRKREEENRKETGGKAPKAPEQKKPKTSEHKETGGKAPKAPERKQTAGKTPKMTEHKTTGGKKPKTPATKGPEHVDDDEFELDINTGKFIRKKKAPVTEKGDESTSRKRKPTSNTSKPSDTGDESKGRDKKKKKMTSVPLLEDDDNNEDDDLQVVDDEDHDKDYEPENDKENDETTLQLVMMTMTILKFLHCALGKQRKSRHRLRNKQRHNDESKNQGKIEMTESTMKLYHYSKGSSVTISRYVHLSSMRTKAWRREIGA